MLKPLFDVAFPTNGVTEKYRVIEDFQNDQVN